MRIASLASILLCLTACAKPAPTTQAADPVRQLVDGFQRAEAASDGARVSSLFSSDGALWINGKQVAQGPDAIRKYWPPRVPWSERTPASYCVWRIQYPKPSLAVVDTVRSYYSPIGRNEAECVFTLVKQPDGSWRILSYDRRMSAKLHVCP